MITKAPIITHYKKNLKTIVESNFSENFKSEVFFGLGKDGLLHLVAFFFPNLNLHKCNYEIYYVNYYSIF